MVDPSPVVLESQISSAAVHDAHHPRRLQVTIWCICCIWNHVEMHLYITPHASWLPEYIQETYKILIEWPETNSLQWILPSSWSGSWEICTCLGLSLFDWFSLYGSLAVVVLWWGVFCICFDCCTGEIQDHVEMSRKKHLTALIWGICAEYWAEDDKSRESCGLLRLIKYLYITSHDFPLRSGQGPQKNRSYDTCPHDATWHRRGRERERGRDRDLDI